MFSSVKWTYESCHAGVRIQRDAVCDRAEASITHDTMCVVIILSMGLLSLPVSHRVGGGTASYSAQR